ncbi:hypothetical protein NDU88_003351 [Pleurodeles waltl]|uniref:Uncharacterized protein n=1 Tax=Pleurodeles waltl TaxID=8319 RepID=A0AAV7SF00_PLEWA|nr:hypothetical protein NDU88_003351 [Pleurodeles waltl]
MDRHRLTTDGLTRSTTNGLTRLMTDGMTPPTDRWTGTTSRPLDRHRFTTNGQTKRLATDIYEQHQSNVNCLSIQSDV